MVEVEWDVRNTHVKSASASFLWLRRSVPLHAVAPPSLFLLVLLPLLLRFSLSPWAGTPTLSHHSCNSPVASSLSNPA